MHSGENSKARSAIFRNYETCKRLRPKSECEKFDNTNTTEKALHKQGGSSNQLRSQGGGS